MFNINTEQILVISIACACASGYCLAKYAGQVVNNDLVKSRKIIVYVASAATLGFSYAELSVVPIVIAVYASSATTLGFMCAHHVAKTADGALPILKGFFAGLLLGPPCLSTTLVESLVEKSLFQ